MHMSLLEIHGSISNTRERVLRRVSDLSSRTQKTSSFCKRRVCMQKNLCMWIYNSTNIFIQETYMYEKETCIYVYTTEHLSSRTQQTSASCKRGVCMQKRPVICTYAIYTYICIYVYIYIYIYIYTCIYVYTTEHTQKNAGARTQTRDVYVCKRDLYISNRDVYVCKRDLSICMYNRTHA